MAAADILQWEKTINSGNDRRRCEVREPIQERAAAVGPIPGGGDGTCGGAAGDGVGDVAGGGGAGGGGGGGEQAASASAVGEQAALAVGEQATAVVMGQAGAAMEQAAGEQTAAAAMGRRQRGRGRRLGSRRLRRRWGRRLGSRRRRWRLCGTLEVVREEKERMGWGWACGVGSGGAESADKFYFLHSKGYPPSRCELCHRSKRDQCQLQKRGVEQSVKTLTNQIKTEASDWFQIS
jgi:hypothetical protein